MKHIPVACFVSAMVAASSIVATSKAFAAEFTQDTDYSEEVISVSPYRIKYTLDGGNRHAPADFPSLALTGQGTFVYVLAGSEVMLYSDGLYIGSSTDYFWPYKSFVNTDPSHPVSSITAMGGVGFGFHYTSVDGQQFTMKAAFVVELKPGFGYDPGNVHMQAVYLTTRGAPYIDIFRPR